MSERVVFSESAAFSETIDRRCVVFAWSYSGSASKVRERRNCRSRNKEVGYVA